MNKTEARKYCEHGVPVQMVGWSDWRYLCYHWHYLVDDDAEKEGPPKYVSWDDFPDDSEWQFPPEDGKLSQKQLKQKWDNNL